MAHRTFGDLPGRDGGTVERRHKPASALSFQQALALATAAVLAKAKPC